MKTEVSIIIVNYKVDKLLIECIRSIYESKIKIPFEIIVVDNSYEENLKKKLSKAYPKVRYIISKNNLGFGAGNNLGVKYAKGDYLFFLNPDTEVTGSAIEILYKFLHKNQEVGIVSPLIIGKDSKPLDGQGYKELNFINGIFTFSFLRKKFSQFSISSFYSSEDWKKSPIKQVDTVYGAAFMIRAKIFDQIKGFDENFFLFFEENDLSKRVRRIGYKLYINSNAKIIHEVGQSTRQLHKRDDYFSKSRFLYFKKHFGLLQALLFEAILKINKTAIFLLILFITALILRTYNLQNSMEFIGDQGWFYISARDLLINGQIPLVGITSSHTWLHQGPLWTYMLSTALLLGRFNPLYGAYLTSAIGSLTVILIFKFISGMFSKTAGVLAASLYAVSPLIVSYDRTPFDPSPIPFFTVIYLYAFYKWANNSLRYFPVLIFTIAILYNLELATFTLFFPFAVIFLYGLFKKSEYVTKLLNPKTIILSVIAGLVPMLPVIIYDLSNGFKQTIVFFGWTLYKPIIGLFFHSHSGTFSYKQIIGFLVGSVQNIIFQNNVLIALIIFFFSFIFLTYWFIRKPLSIKKPEFIVLLILIVSFAGIIVNRIPSGAYLPIIFPLVVIMTGLFFSYLFKTKIIKYLTFVVFLIIILLNAQTSIIQAQNQNFQSRIKAVDKVIALSKNQKYNLIGQGSGSQFRSFTMNYEYLLWWKKHPVSEKNERLKIFIKEERSGISVYKKL